MSYATRELTIVYGTLSIGGASQAFIPVGGWLFERGYREGIVKSDVLVKGSTAADLLTQLSTFHGQLKQRNLNLTVTVNGQTLISADHANATGFNCLVQTNEVESEMLTGLTRLFEVTWRFQVPELTALAGRRDSSIEVRYSPERVRTVTIRVEYTAISSAGALAQYQTAITAYAASVQTLLGVVAWRLIRESIPIDDQNKLVVNASQVYKELHAEHAASILNSSQIVDPQILIRRSASAPGDSVIDGETPRRLIVAEVTFSMAIDSAVTTNEQAVWDGLVLPALIDHTLQAFGGSGAAADVTLAPQIEWVENRISGSCFL